MTAFKDFDEAGRAGFSAKEAGDSAKPYGRNANGGETLAIEKRLPTICAADFEGMAVPQREWLVDGAVPQENVTLLSGDGGVGKTILALMLGISLSSCTDWLELKAMQGPSIYLGAEDDPKELHRRLDLIRCELGISWGALADFHLSSLAGEDALLSRLDHGIMKPTELCAKLETRIRDLGAIACFLDTSADVFGGDEISRTQVRQFIGLLRGIAIRNHVSVVLLAHPSLSGMASGSGTSGSTAWSNSVRSRMYLEADGKDNDARVLKFMKSNYGPKGEPMRLRWRNGLFVPDDGKADESVRANAEAKFMQMLDLYNAQERHASALRSCMYAPTIFSRDPMCQGFTMHQLQDAMNSLFAKQQIIVEVFGPPSKQRKRIIRK